VHYRALFADLLGEDSVGRPATDTADRAETVRDADRAETVRDADRADTDRAEADRADAAGDGFDGRADGFDGRANTTGNVPDAERPDATRAVDPRAVNEAAGGRHAAEADPTTNRRTTNPDDHRATAGRQEDFRA